MCMLRYCLAESVGTKFGVGVGEARPEGPRAEGGVLREGAASHPHQLWSFWERCKLPSRVRPPKGFLVFCAVRLPFPASQYVLHTVCMARY